MTLYELTVEWAQLAEMLDAAESDGERDEILSAMEERGGDIVEKCEAYARIRLNKEAEIDALGTEIRRLQGIKKAKESSVARLTENMRAAMEATGTKRIETKLGTWSRVQNPWSVNVTDAAKVPAEYHIPQPDEIDKRAILTAFKETGEVFDGVEMIRKESVRFR